MLPNAEVYVYEEDGGIPGFIEMDTGYIVGILVAAGHKGQEVGHQLIETVEKKKQLSLHMFGENTGVMAFYLREGFTVRERTTEKETEGSECLMVYESREWEPELQERALFDLFGSENRRW